MAKVEHSSENDDEVPGCRKDEVLRCKCEPRHDESHERREPPGRGIASADASGFSTATSSCAIKPKEPAAAEESAARVIATFPKALSSRFFMSPPPASVAIATGSSATGKCAGEHPAELIVANDVRLDQTSCLRHRRCFMVSESP